MTYDKMSELGEIDVLVAILEKIGLGITDDHMAETTMTSVYLRLWKYLGLWPLEDGEDHWRHHISPYFTLVVQCYCIALHTYSLLWRNGNLLNATEQLFTLLFIAMGLTKLSTYLFQRDDQKALVDELDLLNATTWRTGTPETRAFLRKARVVSAIFSTVMPRLCTVFMLATILSLNAISVYIRKPLFSVHYPCDTSRSPCLELVILQDFFVCCTTLVYVGLCDLFFVDLLFQTWIEARILNYNVANIRDYALNKLMEERDNAGSLCVAKNWRIKAALGASKQAVSRRRYARTVGRSAVKVAPPARVDGQQVKRGVRKVVSRRRTAVKVVTPASADIQVNHGVKKKKNYWSMLASNVEVDLAIQARLVECVRLHNAICALLRHLQLVFNPFLASQMMINLIESAIIALYILMVSSWGVKEYGMMVVELWIMAQLFVFAWLSNTITKECSDVGRSVYFSDWQWASEKCKRSLRIVISRSNTPVILTVFGWIPLSLEMYSQVSKSAVSYLMTMRAILHK